MRGQELRKGRGATFLRTDDHEGEARTAWRLRGRRPSPHVRSGLIAGFGGGDGYNGPLRLGPEAIDVAENGVESRAFNLRRMGRDRLRRSRQQAVAGRVGEPERMGYRPRQGLPVGPRQDAVLSIAAEAAVADRVQRHDDTTRRHGLQRRQVEAFGPVGQADRDLCLREHPVECAAMAEPQDGLVGNGTSCQALRHGHREFRTLVAYDNDAPRPRRPGRAGRRIAPIPRREIRRVRNGDDRPPGPSRGHDGVRDLGAYADADRPPRQVVPEFRVRVAHMLDQVDARVVRPVEGHGAQVAPVRAGDEQHVPRRWRPASHAVDVADRPEAPAFPCQGFIQGSSRECDTDREPRHPSGMVEIVRVLDLAARHPLEGPVEPDRTLAPRVRHRPDRMAAAARSQSEWLYQADHAPSDARTAARIKSMVAAS